MAHDGLARTKEKWGEGAIEAGFTILPNHLLAINLFLEPDRRLTPTEMFVLLQVLLAWWSAERLPFPSKASIAARTALSTRQIQRALGALEAKGLLRRTARYEGGRGRMTNLYDPKGIVDLIGTFATMQPNVFAHAATQRAT